RARRHRRDWRRRARWRRDTPARAPPRSAPPCWSRVRKSAPRRAFWPCARRPLPAGEGHPRPWLALCCCGVSVRWNPRLCNGLIAAILLREEARRAAGGLRPRGAQPSRGAGLSIPNLITVGRILLVPVVIWAITAGEMRIAFILFVAAGISDAVDGFLAKRFGMSTELGAYLDPLADKAMLVSIYVALGIAEAIPRWLVILV